DLKNAGLEPWLDTEDLLPGQLWKTAIDKAIRESSYFLVLLSFNSVTKEKGFIN
ncbi:MAG TPA: serine/threonine-protein kinase pkn1, partial [Desulfobacteraceae bacterium]|nr:serine/threonine-protein kinase pkn1 [Desulfobacteraceae bacterium]